MLRNPRMTLAILIALNLLNYIDRFELAAVLPKIKLELGLSNFVAGILATVFLASFLITAPLFGWLGDRTKRMPLLAAGAFVWGSATIASGLAHSAEHLLIARAFVGVGEASFTTLAPTVIYDLAPEAARPRWLGWFHLAAPLGAALGFILGGQLEKFFGWHVAFFAGGAPGILLGLLVLTLAEPLREVRPATAAGTANSGILHAIRELLAVRPFRRACLGYIAQTFAVGGFSYWAPTYLEARFGLKLGQATFGFGVVTVAAGSLATLLGAKLAERVEARLSARSGTALAHAELAAEKIYALLRICASGGFLAAPMAAACFLSPTPQLFFAAAFVCMLGIFLSNAPVNLVILRSVPAHLRAIAMSVAIMSIHLFGDLWSPAAIGKLADAVGEQRFHLAMLPLALFFGLSALAWWARRLPGERAAGATNSAEAHG